MIVIAAAGSISLPVLLKALVAREERAASTLPARDSWIALREFTNPKRMKNMATKDWPWATRRKNGFWKMAVGAVSFSPGGTMYKAKHIERWLKTTKTDAIPRSPYLSDMLVSISAGERGFIPHLHPPSYCPGRDGELRFCEESQQQQS